jgi:NCS2 family nucleobase:cation symporter-2/xanthine permease XanP
MSDMAADTSDLQSRVRYEPHDRPPALLAAGLGLQLTILTISGIVITPLIVIQAAGGPEAYMMWAVFGSVVVSGISTIFQAVRVGRIGAGYVLLMGTSGAFIAICITAIAEGGPAMLATLVIISSLFQFALARRLSLFRRVLTPTVAGTVIMLIPVTVMPIIFDLLGKVPDGAPAEAAPLSAVVTLLVIVGIAVKATGVLRLWAPVAGVVAGAMVGGYFGIYDTTRIADAPWIGFPDASAWPGFDLSFGPVFWALLPGFVFVTLIGAIETVGDAVAIQRVSWRRPRAVNFRSVQGAVTADGVGNFLSGCVGTVPNTTYSSSVSVTELTGVGARTVGIAAGLIFLALACFPKALSVILAIPSPVAGAYVSVLLAILFIVGIKVLIQDGIDYRNGLIAGVSFWVGVGFQSGVIFPEVFAELAGGLLQNGMTAGGLTALILTMFVEFTEPRRRRIEVPFQVSVLPEIRTFLQEFATRSGWGQAMTNRLDSASEETLLTLLEQYRAKDQDEDAARRLLLVAHREGDEAVLEFIASTGEANLQDQIALLSERATEAPVEHEVSLRLLRHVASSVHHQQYHDTDIVTVRVKAPVDSDP